MALDALGNSYFLVLLPGLVSMNVGMAVCAADIFLHVHTVVMFGIFFLVTAFTGYFVNLCLATHMFGKIGYLDVAACTGILAVDRRSESGDGDFVAVTAEAGGRVYRHTLFSETCGPESQD
jgi:hypothetical protein